LRLSDRIFFITVTLRRRLPPFTGEEYSVILSTLDESRRRLGFALCGYVLMPDHWHALLSICAPLTISRVIRDVKSVSALRLNRSRGRQGALWQHQFWDRFVRHQREYSQRLNYMHSNPVRKGLVGKPEEWRWSSFRNFSRDEAERAACPIQFDYIEMPDSYRG
jgi:putative transposase